MYMLIAFLFHFNLQISAVSFSSFCQSGQCVSACTAPLALNIYHVVMQIVVGLCLLLLSYACLVGRSFILVYHGYKHDFLAATAQGDGEPLSSNGGGVTVGTGQTWTTLPNFLREVFVLVSASLEEGLGVWGGKNSEIGTAPAHLLV